MGITFFLPFDKRGQFFDALCSSVDENILPKRGLLVKKVTFSNKGKLCFVLAFEHPMRHSHSGKHLKFTVLIKMIRND